MRFGVVLAGLFALGALARLWQLDTLPSPAGDETNWLFMGLNVARGETPRFQMAFMGFVPTTFAYLIGGAFALLGPTFWTARLVPALGSLLCIVAVVTVARKWRCQTLSLALAALLLLHPWSVVWSRLVFAPYGLSLPLAIVGPLCWLHALERPDSHGKWLALIAAGQLLVLGLHFSPLSAIPIVACALWTFFRPGRIAPAAWVAAVLMAVHACPIIWGALKVAAILLPLPSVAHGELLSVQLSRYVLANIDVISGEAVVREFTNVAFRGGPLWLARAGMLLLLAVAPAVYVYRRRARSLVSLRAPSQPPPPEVTKLGTFSLIYLLLALVGVPLILGVGRPWSMPLVESERYGFALLAPVMLGLAVAAARIPGFRYALGLFVACFCLAPCLRLADALHNGGGPELGFINFDGGGLRMWRAVRGPVSIPAYLGAVVRREGAKENVAFIAMDAFGFHAVRFAVAVPLAERCIAVAIHENPKTGAYRWPQQPEFPPGVLLVCALWPESMFVATEIGLPSSFRTREDARRDREEFLRHVANPELLEVVRQPDGSPLFEIWRGRYRKPPPRKDRP